MEDTETPQQALTAAEDHLRQGARTVGPRHPARYAVVTCAAATAVGATFDIPATWHDIGAILRFPLPLIIIAGWTLYTRNSWRARPRPRGYGRHTMAVVLGVHVIVFLAATALGRTLNQAHIPAPFTLAGLAYGVAVTALVLAAAGWAKNRYVDRISRGQW